MPVRVVLALKSKMAISTGSNSLLEEHQAEVSCLKESDLKVIYSAIFEVRAKWRRISMQLGLSTGDLDAIALKDHTPDDQLERALIMWLNKGKGTWAHLVEALHSVPVGETALAKQLAKEYCQSDTPQWNIKEDQLGNFDDISTIEPEFALLSMNIRESLKKRGVNPQTLAAYLLSFQSTRGALKINKNYFIIECQEDLKRAETIDAVFVIVSQFWSFLDYTLLEYVVQAFGDDNDKQRLAYYVESLQNFLSSWRVVPYKINNSDIPISAVKLCFKLDTDLLPYRDIRASVARIFRVHISNVLIYSIETGCTELIFLLPRTALVSPLTAEEKTEIAKVTPSVIKVMLLEGHEETVLFMDEEMMATEMNTSHGTEETEEAAVKFKEAVRREPEGDSMQQRASAESEERLMGFDCEFVEHPPEHLQTHCPVCLLIIREPQQVTCCGNSFCYSCIHCIKTENKPCPTCKECEFSVFPDKRLKRTLYSFKVQCNHHKDGCEWTGELRQLDEHHNKDSPPENRLQGCLMVTIHCEFEYIGCTHTSLRGRILEHLEDYSSQHISLLATGYSKKQGELQEAQATIIQLKKQQQVLQNKNIDLQQENIALKLKAKLVQNENDVLQKQTRLKHLLHEEKKTELEHNCQTLKTSLSSLNTKYAALSASHAKLQIDNVQQKAQIDILTADIDTLRTKTVVRLQQGDKTGPLVFDPQDPPVFAMNNYSEYKKYDDIWHSPPMYTHPNGYKICLRVYANGSGPGKGTHLTVFLCFMKGEFDDFLKWPFRGIIGFQLLNQTGVSEHIKDFNRYSDTVDDMYCERVIVGDRGSGYGTPKFISHWKLESEYVHNNTLFFQIYDLKLHI